jgi:hypothetical protein
MIQLCLNLSLRSEVGRHNQRIWDRGWLESDCPDQTIYLIL